jgi:PmbA protein
VTFIESTDTEANIHLGEIENLVEASTAHLSLRIFKDRKTAIATSSDFSRNSLHDLIKNALYRATLGNPDTYAGLPPSRSVSLDIDSLNLYDPAIAELRTENKIKLATNAEKIALNDKRIINSHGSSFETRIITNILGNSNGFLNSYEETVCSLSLGLQAGETDNLVEDSWDSTKRYFEDLESPEAIAKKAVERTVRQINPRRISTQKVPVILEQPMTSWLLGFLFACISGVSVYQRTTFLADMLGKKIGNRDITVLDDGLKPRLLGTTPFDSEGVPSQKTEVIHEGRLENFLCNTYAAKKLNLKSTGNAGGNNVSPHNFYLQNGDHEVEDMIASMEKGLLLTRTIGHGLNPVTGDISRGAYGLWIKNGEIAFPVSGITIAGNLKDILNGIDMIGNDLNFRGVFSGPSLKIHELMIAGG